MRYFVNLLHPYVLVMLRFIHAKGHQINEMTRSLYLPDDFFHAMQRCVFVMLPFLVCNGVKHVSNASKDISSAPFHIRNAALYKIIAAVSFIHWRISFVFLSEETPSIVHPD